VLHHPKAHYAVVGARHLPVVLLLAFGREVADPTPCLHDLFACLPDADTRGAVVGTDIAGLARPSVWRLVIRARSKWQSRAELAGSRTGGARS
jgi:hypothetical protein